MDADLATNTYEDDQRDYEMDREGSPRRDRDGDSRGRSASPNGRAGGDHAPADYGRRDDRRPENDEPNPGSNLFVTGLSSRVTDDILRELFSQYGTVENASVMKDPHTRDSRGFGFVKFATVESATEAMEKLHGHDLEGRTISIEKAKRNNPRKPTPGRYQGRDDRYGSRRGGGRRDDYRSGPPRGGERGGERYGGDRYRSEPYDRRDRERSGYGGYGGRGGGFDRRRDDYGPPPREDRYGGGGYGYRDERGPSGGDRGPPPPYDGHMGGGRYDDRR